MISSVYVGHRLRSGLTMQIITTSRSDSPIKVVEIGTQNLLLLLVKLNDYLSNYLMQIKAFRYTWF